MGRFSADEPAETADEPTLEARNARLVRDYFSAIWNDGDLETFDTDMVSDEYVFHHQTDGTYTVDELRTAWADWYEAFPDLRNEIEDVIATADRVVVRYRFSGTHEAAVFGVPATGAAVETAGIVVFHIDDGQIVEAWAVDDVHGLLQQLGGHGVAAE